MTFPLLAHFRENMRFVRAKTLYFSCSGNFESLLSAGMCFHFWHNLLLFKRTAKVILFSKYYKLRHQIIKWGKAFRPKSSFSFSSFWGRSLRSFACLPFWAGIPVPHIPLILLGNAKGAILHDL